MVSPAPAQGGGFCPRWARRSPGRDAPRTPARAPAPGCRLRGRAPRCAGLGASAPLPGFRGAPRWGTRRCAHRCAGPGRTRGRAHSTLPPRCERHAGRRTDPASPRRRHASPTHLLQKLGQIVHLVVQDQPGALAVVVLLDLFQGVVLDRLVRLLGHFGTRWASGRAHTSRAGRSGARVSASRARDIPGAPARRPELGGPRCGGGGGARPPVTGQNSCHSKGPPSADTLRQPERAPAQRAGGDWLRKVPFRNTVAGACGGRGQLRRASRRGGASLASAQQAAGQGANRAARRTARPRFGLVRRPRWVAVRGGFAGANAQAIHPVYGRDFAVRSAQPAPAVTLEQSLPAASPLTIKLLTRLGDIKTRSAIT